MYISKSLVQNTMNRTNKKKRRNNLPYDLYSQTQQHYYNTRCKRIEFNGFYLIYKQNTKQLETKIKMQLK